VRLPFKARAYIGGTVTAGIFVVTVAAVRAAHVPLRTLALLGAAVIVTELFQVSGDERSPDPVDVHQFSFSSAVHIATIVVLGPWAGALVGAFGVLIVDHLGRSPWRRVLFNASVFALSTLAAGYVFVAAGGTVGAIRLPHDLPALCALGIAYGILNSLLVSGIVSLTGGTRLAPLVWASVRTEVSPKAAEAGLGAAIAVFALRDAWDVVVLVPLLVAVYQGHARLAQLRRETARALETFANVVDERDRSTFQHSARVANYVEELAHALALPAPTVARLRWAGRLHDLGKITVDAGILRSSDRLDTAGWAAMRRHPRLSARLLRRFRFAAEEALAVEYHHERFDGGGY
jgi:putative nucleotidyltransferase with HDIG domain